jgi:hypothetical protein
MASLTYEVLLAAAARGEISRNGRGDLRCGIHQPKMIEEQRS